MSLCAELMMAESLAELCFAANGGIEARISENELHYLRTIAVAHDDDVISCLLLKKLARAKVCSPSLLAPDTVVMNSFVEFTMSDGDASFGQLVWPSRDLPYGISVTSPLGAGLIGLRSGQTVLWPAEGGGLHPLQVMRVENGVELSRWFES